MNYVVNKLIELNRTISTMESCTGGCVSNSITNIPGSSDIFKFGAVTYSNEYKIKLGVDKNLIDVYSVYSKEVSDAMSRTISIYTNSDYGIGVTGKLNREDKNNEFGSNNVVYISVYDKNNNKFHNQTVTAIYEDREKNKELVLNKIINILEEIL